MVGIAGRLVSIIVPCHNAARFLPEALDSALAQTHAELEIVAIDDGSEDGTGEILREAGARDDRLRALVNEQNLGIVPTLNRAVAEARGAFIARMDADDVLASERIERQLEALASRPEIGVVGSAIVVIDESGRAIGRRPVRCTQPAAAPFLALFAIPVMHATVMARAEVMHDFPYRSTPECLHTEDYDLFTRMLAGGVQMLNIDAPLYGMRRHSAGVSNRFEPVQVANFVELAKRQLERTLGIQVSDRVHRVLVNRMNSTTGGDLRRGLQWLTRLRDQYLEGSGGDDDVSSAEVRAITDQQRIDILGQAVLKGPLTRRILGLALSARYSSVLRTAPGRQYLRDKVAYRGPSARKWIVARPPKAAKPDLGVEDAP